MKTQNENVQKPQKEQDAPLKKWESPQLIKEDNSITEGGAKTSKYEIPVQYHT